MLRLGRGQLVVVVTPITSPVAVREIASQVRLCCYAPASDDRAVSLSGYLKPGAVEKSYQTAWKVKKGYLANEGDLSQLSTSSAFLSGGKTG